MLRLDNRQHRPGKSMYVDKLARYFAMRLMDLSCTKCGLLQNHAHWCTAINISGCVYPLRYLNIPKTDL